MLYSWRTYPSLFHGLRFICIIYCHVSATSILVTCIKSRGFVDLREHWRRYLMMWITVYWFISWKSFPSVEGLTRSIKVGRIQYDFFFREIIWHNFEHHAKCKQSCIEILRNSFHRNIAQCGNFIIFLSLRFYVKSIFQIIDVLKLQFLTFLGLWVLLIW